MKRAIERLAEKILVAGVLLMISAASASSQLIWEAGYAQGIGGNTILPVPPAGCCNPKLDEHYRQTTWTGLGFQLSDFFGSGDDLAARASFAYSASGIIQRFPPAVVYYPLSKDTTQAARANVAYVHRVWTGSIWIDLLGRFPLSGPLGLDLGLRFSCRLHGRFEKRMHITTLDGSLMHIAGHGEVADRGTALNSAPLSAGALAGITYDIPFISTIMLRPGIHLYYDVGTFRDGAFWETAAIGGNLGIVFGNTN